MLQRRLSVLNILTIVYVIFVIVVLCIPKLKAENLAPSAIIVLVGLIFQQMTSYFHSD